jgi:hypothetical protein
MKKIQAVTPRLSDEDLDPLEQDESDNSTHNLVEGWFPWDADDIFDIKRLIHDKMTPRQKAVFVAFLDGRTHIELGVSEKYWRYHFEKGIEFIKRELRV